MTSLDVLDRRSSVRFFTVVKIDTVRLFVHSGANMSSISDVRVLPRL